MEKWTKKCDKRNKNLGDIASGMYSTNECAKFSTETMRYLIFIYVSYVCKIEWKFVLKWTKSTIAMWRMPTAASRAPNESTFQSRYHHLTVALIPFQLVSINDFDYYLAHFIFNSKLNTMLLLFILTRVFANVELYAIDLWFESYMDQNGAHTQNGRERKTEIKRQRHFFCRVVVCFIFISSFYWKIMQTG